VNELVLAPPLDTRDSFLLQLQRLLVRKLARERGMQRSDGGDCLAFDCSPEAAHRFLDFG
jgi:hypothetical protein